MKIRTGFVSNSSGSSFVLIHLPENFDFYAYKEKYMDDPSVKKYGAEPYISSLTENDIIQLRRKGRVHQTEAGEKYYALKEFLHEFVVFTVTTQEEDGWIKITNKAFFDKMVSLDEKSNEINSKYGAKAAERRERREIMRQKMKHVDPYEEEDWGDMDESNKIKKFNEL
jgi:hypothetical protein